MVDCVEVALLKLFYQGSHRVRPENLSSNCPVATCLRQVKPEPVHVLVTLAISILPSGLFVAAAATITAAAIL